MKKSIIAALAMLALVAAYVSAGIGVTCYADGAQNRFWDTDYVYECETNLSAASVDFGGVAMANHSGVATSWNVSTRLSALTTVYPRYRCGEVNISVTPTPASTTSVDQVYIISNLTGVPCVVTDDSDYTITQLTTTSAVIATNLSIRALTSTPNMTLTKGTPSSTTADYQVVLITDSQMGTLGLAMPVVAYNSTDVYAPYAGEETQDKVITVTQRFNETPPGQILPTGVVGDAPFVLLGGAVMVGTAYALLRRRAVNRTG